MDSGPPRWKPDDPRLTGHASRIVSIVRQDFSPDRERRCWCTGECGGDKSRCPAMTAPLPTFAEVIQEAISHAERVGEPHLAEAIRQAVKDTPNG